VSRLLWVNEERRRKKKLGWPGSECLSGAARKSASGSWPGIRPGGCQDDGHKTKANEVKQCDSREEEGSLYPEDTSRNDLSAVRATPLSSQSILGGEGRKLVATVERAPPPPPPPAWSCLNTKSFQAGRHPVGKPSLLGVRSLALFLYCAPTPFPGFLLSGGRRIRMV